MSNSMQPEDFMAMMDAIEKIANTYNLQIGFACDRGDNKPEDKSQIVINLEPMAKCK